MALISLEMGWVEAKRPQYSLGWAHAGRGAHAVVSRENGGVHALFARAEHALGRPAFYIVADDTRGGDAITQAAKALGLTKKQPFPSPFSMDLIEGDVVGRVK